MRQPVKVSTIIRRWVMNLPADVLKWLAENEAELQKVCDGLEPAATACWTR